MRLFLIITCSIVCAVFILANLAAVAVEKQVREDCSNPRSPLYANKYYCPADVVEREQRKQWDAFWKAITPTTPPK